MFHPRFLSGSATAAILCLVVGCGGGGDVASLVITAQNAETSASQGVGAADFLMSMAELSDEFSGSIESQGALLIPCDAGNVNISINDVGEQNVLSTGDSVSVDFQGCSFVDDDVTLNGGMSMTASEVTDLGEGVFTVRLTVVFSALTIVSPDGTAVVNGGFTSELSSTDGTTLRSIVSGSSLSAFAEGGGEVFSGSIKDFRLVRQFDTEEEGYLVEIDATISGSELNGQVTYETLVPFQGTGDGDPQSGTMVIHGANGAKVSVVATGEGNVDLRVDLDGDGDTDVTIPTTWDELTDGEISGSTL